MSVTVKSASIGPSIVTDGLVLLLDADNSQSYPGEPTTNLIDPSYHASYSTGVYTVNPPSNPDGWYTAHATQTAANWHIFRLELESIPNGGTYTFQVEMISPSGNIEPLITGSAGVGLMTNVNGNKWTLTWTNNLGTSKNEGIYWYYIPASTTTINETWYYRFYQIENKDHATQFVNGTRLATDGWKDLVGTNNGDISNMSYTDNAEMIFNGGLASGDYVSLDSFVIDLNSYTVEFWIKRNVLTTTQDIGNTNGGLRILNGVNGYMNFLDYTISSGNFYFRAERSINEEYWATMSTGIVADIEWHHVVISSTSGNQTLYFDGKYISTSSPTFTTNNVTINSIGKGYGYTSTYYGSYFDGYISNFKYYNKPLTSTEAFKNYNTLKNRFEL